MYVVLITISSKLNSLGLNPVVCGEAASRMNNGSVPQNVNTNINFMSLGTSKRVWILVSCDWLRSVKDKIRLNFGLEKNPSFHRKLL
jgi:hypothetical protein